MTSYQLPFDKPVEELTKAEAMANFRTYVGQIPAVLARLEVRLESQLFPTIEDTAAAFVALAGRLVMRPLTRAEAASLDLSHLPDVARESMRGVIAAAGRYEDGAELLLFELSNLLAETLRVSRPWCWITLGAGPKRMIDFNLPVVASHICNATINPYRYSMHLAEVAQKRGEVAVIEAIRSRIDELSGLGDSPPYRLQD